jgi:hypothetical protein
MRIIYCGYGLVVGGVALFIHDLRQLANPSFEATYLSADTKLFVPVE